MHLYNFDKINIGLTKDHVSIKPKETEMQLQQIKTYAFRNIKVVYPYGGFEYFKWFEYDSLIGAHSLILSSFGDLAPGL